MRDQLHQPLLLLLLAAACSDVQRSAESDLERTTAAADSAPTRVVSLLPSATELIVALDAADRLVARTDHDTDPAVLHLPSVGAGQTPNLESLAALQPQLVVTWPEGQSSRLITKLTDLGARTYSPESQTLGDIISATRQLGRLLGVEAKADTLVENIRADLAAVQNSVRGGARPSVFYVVWNEPPMTAGPGTFIDEMIEIAGGRNVFHDSRIRWPTVSLEEVVRRQPDFVIIGQDRGRPMNIERMRTAAGWRELAAIRSNRLVEVDSDLFNRPGPRVADAARRLAAVLHPDRAVRAGGK